MVRYRSYSPSRASSSPATIRSSRSRSGSVASRTFRAASAFGSLTTWCARGALPVHFEPRGGRRDPGRVGSRAECTGAFAALGSSSERLDRRLQDLGEDRVGVAPGVDDPKPRGLGGLELEEGGPDAPMEREV